MRRFVPLLLSLLVGYGVWTLIQEYVAPPDAPDDPDARETGLAGDDEWPGAMLEGTRVAEVPGAHLLRGIEQRVRVRTLEGRPVPQAVVYALPARDPGKNELQDMPHATTDDDGTCTLLLPTQGAYDIGAKHGVRHALAQRVHPEGQPLIIALPDAVEIRVVPRAAVAERLARLRSLEVHFLPLPLPTDRAFPGRGETLGDRGLVILGKRDTEGAALLAPRDRSYEVRFAGWEAGLEASARIVRAPAQVEIGISGNDPFEAEVRLVATGTAVATPTRVEVRFRWDEGAESALRLTQVIRPWQLEPDDAPPVLRAWLPATGTTLHWSGPGVRPGQIRLMPGEAAGLPDTLDIELHDLTAVPPDPTLATTMTHVVIGLPHGWAETFGKHVGIFNAAARWGLLDLRTAPRGQDTASWPKLEPVPTQDWMAALASRVFSFAVLPPPVQAETRLDLQPGGLIEFIGTAPHKSFGRAQVRFPDLPAVALVNFRGRRVPTSSIETSRFAIQAGQYVALLPVGRVRYQCFVGGMFMSEHAVEITAGGVTTVPLELWNPKLR
jgi:hypothetical protein